MNWSLKNNLNHGREMLRDIDPRRAFKVVLVGVMLLVASLGIEYFWFGRHINDVTGQESQGVREIRRESVQMKGFFVNEHGNFVSESEDALLQVSLDRSYVHSLRINLPEYQNQPLYVEYLDPGTQQLILRQKDLQKSLQKNGLQLFQYQLFPVREVLDHITVHAPKPETVISKIEIDNVYRVNPFRSLFVLVVLSLVSIFWIFRSKIGRNPEYVVFSIIILCGTLISLSEPRAHVSWDERVHYKNADNNSLKTIIRKEVDDIYATTRNVPFSYSLEEQQEIEKHFDNDFKDGPSRNKKRGFSLSEISLRETYNQVAYLPSSFALMLGRMINLPAHMTFVLGRWVNVLVYAAIVFLAIRRLKTGKMIMAVIALFPTALFMASNYNYDSWVIAFTLLGMAYVFSELQQPEKKITSREMATMIGVFVLGLGPKAIYFPLLSVLFLLPGSKFISLSQYRKYLGVTVISILFVLGSFMLPFLVEGPGNGDQRGGEEVNSTEQVAFILSEPIAYSKILLNFVQGYIHPRNAHGFMTDFAYLGTISGFLVISILLMFVVIFDKNEFDRETSTWRVRLLVIGIYLATTALIATALYVVFTPVRDATIAGVQQRYLIPLLFPLLVVIGSSRMKNPINKNLYHAIVLGVMTVVILSGIWHLIIWPHF